jgi:triacylglycerol lipase
LLAGFVEHAGGAPVDVVVTGHSKGGALAQAVALWLADTRGDGAGAERAWDPQGLATVRCFSYASPTVGDAGFAARAVGVLGDGLHRIVNPLDVVPCTWSTTDLARIAALYGHPVAPQPGLGSLVELISASVQPLGYCHVPAQTTHALPAALDPARQSFMDQMAHQHLGSYLGALSLDLDAFE